MQDILTSVLGWTVEYKAYQEAGWLNTLIISSGMMALLTVPETMGIVVQGRTIRREESGKSISNILFFLTFDFFAACIMYGLRVGSVAIIINATVTTVAGMWTIRQLSHYKEITAVDTVVGLVGLVMIPWLALTPHRDESYFVCSLTLWVAFGAQLRELWQQRQTGSLDWRLLVVYTVSCAAWVGFALSTGNEWLQLTQSVLLALVSAILLLWCWLKWREIAASPRS